MKKIKQHPLLFLVVSFVLLVVCLNVFAALTNTYDTATPAGSDDPRFADDRMREIKAAIQERMNDHNGQAGEGDHYWPLTGTEVSDTDAGQHRMVTLRQSAADPSSLTSYATTTDLGFLYQKNVSGNGELFWEDEAGNVVQLTSGGGFAGNPITGNVAITGTLDVTGVMSTTAASVLGDGSTLAAATESGDGDRTIADKAYVDSFVGSSYRLVSVNGTPTKVYTKYLTGTLDSDSATSVSHGITGVDNILHVSVSAYYTSESKYISQEMFKDGVTANSAFYVSYDATNINFVDVGSSVQGQKYRIKVDYVL